MTAPPRLIAAPHRYGKVRIVTIKAAYDDLRAAVRSHDAEAAEAALDRYEQWADYAFGAASTDAQAFAHPLVADLIHAAERLEQQHDTWLGDRPDPYMRALKEALAMIKAAEGGR